MDAVNDIMKILAGEDAPLGRREDGTAKGLGYYGLMPRAGGGVSTELSGTVDGQLIPMMSPNLTWPQMDYLLNQWSAGKRIPRDIVRQANDHAVERRRQGLSPFAD